MLLDFQTQEVNMPTKTERKPLSFSPDELETIFNAADSSPLNQQLVELMSFGTEKEQNRKGKLYEDFGTLRADYVRLKEGQISREKFDADRKTFTDNFAALSDVGTHGAKELVKEALAAVDKQIKEIVGRDLP